MLKYEEIIEYIKNEISLGSYNYQKKLPSVRSVSKLFHCSVGTVSKAYDELEKEHLIYSMAKSGYYILDVQNDSLKIENELIDFSSGAPDINTLPYKKFQHCLNKAIDLYKEKLFTYSDPQGLDSLIQILADHFQEYQVFTKPENIIITTGSQQALNILSTMPFPNGKTHVLVEQPTYYGMIKSLELNHIPRLGIERGLKGLNLDELENIFRTGDIKFFYTISRFHNPTGVSYNRQEKEAIVELAGKYNVYIVEDDIMGDLEVNKKNDPMYSYDISSRVIYLKSYSKILIPGLRIAVAVLPELLLNTFLEYKQWSDMHSPILSQGALEIYLKSGMFDVHKNAIGQLYFERMNCLREILSQTCPDNIKWFVPESGYFSCLYTEDKLNYERISRDLQNRSISLFDTSNCFLREYKNNKFFRISVSKTNEEKIKKGIPILLDIIQKHAKEGK